MSRDVKQYTQLMDATDNFLNNYVDEYGRCELKKRNPNTIGNYSSENPHLFTGYMCVVFRLHGVQNQEWKRRIIDVTNKSFRTKGVLMRQPSYESNFYPKGHPQYPQYNNVSHDEISGTCMSAICFDNLSWVRDMVEWLDGHYLTMDDHTLRINPIFFVKLKTYAFLKYAINDNNIFLDYQLMQYFLTVSIGREHDLSGEIMRWYTYQCLCLVRKPPCLLRKAYSFYESQMKKRFGSNWLIEIHSIYFKDKNHPIHELIKAL